MQRGRAMPRTGVVWLRCGDLRCSDNPALLEASEHCDEILVCFCWAPFEEGRGGGPGAGELELDWSLEGTALQMLLAKTLLLMDARLQQEYGNRLLVLGSREGKSGGAFGAAGMLMKLAKWLKSRTPEDSISLYWNRREEPWERAREDRLKEMAAELGVAARSFPAFLFKEPAACPIFESVARGQHIFKAFWEGWHRGGSVRRAVPAPRRCRPLAQHRGGDLQALLAAWSEDPISVCPAGGGPLLWWPFPGPLPRSRRQGDAVVCEREVSSLIAPWEPLSEQGAWDVLQEFQEGGNLGRYRGSITRDAGPQRKESRLSPYYRLGLLSMVEVYHNVDRAQPEVQKWLRRSTWRDYAYWMFRYWDCLPERPMRPVYLGHRWSTDANQLTAWQLGQTGYPLIDAGMRELLRTGYLQQNLRHTVGQFLVEVLNISWVQGEAWFHATLADCDCAINAMMWQHQGLVGVSQWLTGVDCHPVRHAKKADPDGSYVRLHCPELAALPLKFLHQPWKAPESVLRDARVKLGETYPRRIVEDEVDVERLPNSTFAAELRRCRARKPEMMLRGGADGIERPDMVPHHILPSHMTQIFALTERSVKSARGAESRGDQAEPAQEGGDIAPQSHSGKAGAKGRGKASAAKGRWQKGGDRVKVQEPCDHPQREEGKRSRRTTTRGPAGDVQFSDGSYPEAGTAMPRGHRWRKVFASERPSDNALGA